MASGADRIFKWSVFKHMMASNCSAAYSSLFEVFPAVLSVLPGSLPPVACFWLWREGERKVDVTDSMGHPALLMLFLSARRASCIARAPLAMVKSTVMLLGDWWVALLIADTRTLAYHSLWSLSSTKCDGESPGCVRSAWEVLNGNSLFAMLHPRELLERTGQKFPGAVALVRSIVEKKAKGALLGSISAMRHSRCHDRDRSRRPGACEEAD
jgi:hypothetical protein